MKGQAILVWARGAAGRLVLLAASALLLAVTTAPPARAQFAVCNQTLDAINLAIAKAEPSGIIVSEGWWTVGANRCVDVIKDELANKYIYVYATDVFGQSIYSQDYAGFEMCIGPRRFTIEGTDSCWQRGFQTVRFLEVDTRDQVRWTLFLKEPDSS